MLYLLQLWWLQMFGLKVCCSLEEKTQAIYGLQFLKMGAKENKPGEIWAEA